MLPGNRERRVGHIHKLWGEILGLTFEELAARTHPSESDWPELSKAYSVVFTWAAAATRAANAEAGPRPWEALTAGSTVREILVAMDEAHRFELQEAIDYAALSQARGRPRRLRWWGRRPS